MRLPDLDLALVAELQKRIVLTMQEFAGEFQLNQRQLMVIAIAAAEQAPQLSDSAKVRRLITQARVLRKKGRLPLPSEKRPGRKFMHARPVRTRLVMRVVELRAEGLSSEDMYEQLKNEKIANPLPAWRTIRRWVSLYEAESAQRLTRTVSKTASSIRNLASGELRPNQPSN